MSFAGIFLLVSFISALSILLLTPLAVRLRLVDVPNEARKCHEGSIPLIGGVSIYAGLVMGISLFITPNINSLTYLLCSSIIVALGVADDIRNLSPKLRLVVQSMVAVLMMFTVSGMYIHSLGTMFGFASIDLGVAGYFVTVLAVIAAINAFNMIDGIDGLLGISSLVTFSGMGILFSLNHDTTNMKLTLILSVALIPYLIANLAGGVHEKEKRISKIFMGDTGSMLIGFTVVWLLIQGTQQPSEGSGGNSFSAATALWLIAFPLMDMVRVIVDRVLRGQSPLNADRTHLHHILLNCGDSKQLALLKISTLSAFFAVVGIAMHVSEVREAIIFLAFLMGFVLYTYRVSRLKKKFVQ
ncbi:UDP-N-acetylglucosamine--undecaprenyl-phosphate N-acetylglucosaminephosphotransferase [Thiothrix litoralis]|uniref:Undecaprenyl-phosphate alpha-N-acetylglucosaminyl 1-phosphate transferase n=1 Tax=Thiothrix litoralis TaxID=2891210 RepID=A0ABX7WPM0_9GAMM|nr:UDP-N-acetylglucosamine--undecaprenyl-phosphate N-acetylglucosaminephosphotransferase [Thiothrix litoralis]QTR45126.1 UDP-N-acetylglucosamine--undecaprenyl-phosphate N-acetylglucosaminephosphotransferase [Thiothrix litoralis]